MNPEYTAPSFFSGSATKLKNPPVAFHVFSEIDDTTTTAAAEAVEQAAKSGQPCLPVYINSPGGEVSQTFAILNILRTCPVPVYTIVCGEAKSAATAIFAIGKKRYASIDSVFMVHDISMSGSFSVKSVDMQSEAKEMSRQQKAVFSMMSKCCGQKSSYFHDLVKKNNNTDVYLSFSDAKDINLVTEPPGIPVLQLRVKRHFTFGTRKSAGSNTAGVWEEYFGKKKKDKISKKKLKKFTPKIESNPGIKSSKT